MRPLTILFLFIIFTVLPVAAQTPADLAGSWTYAREAGGHVYRDALDLAVVDGGLTGTTTYMEEGTEQHEIFRDFEIAPTGRITFVAERPGGTLAAHKGEFTDDNKSIRGTYDIGMGVGGAFVLSPAGAACPEDMDGRWKCHIQDPRGGAGIILRGALLGDSTGLFKGYLFPDDGHSKSVEGTLAADGTLAMEIYGSVNYSLQGTLAPGEEPTIGLWRSSKGQEGTFVLTRLTD